MFFFFSSRRRHTRSLCDWSSDVCSSDLEQPAQVEDEEHDEGDAPEGDAEVRCAHWSGGREAGSDRGWPAVGALSTDRKSTRLNSSHTVISYAVFCLKKKKEAKASQRKNS